MSTEQKKQAGSCRRLPDTIDRVSKLITSNDGLFALLVPTSFLILAALAFLARPSEMVIFAGFSAVCMAFLKLEEFSEFSGIGFSAKLRDVARKVEAMEVKQTEVDPEADSGDQFGEIGVLQISSLERDALKTIEDSKFTFRTATGIAQNLGLSVPATRRLMTGLEEKSLVARIVTSRRTLAWNITATGRDYLATIAK